MKADERPHRVLASKSGIALVLAHIMLAGGMCEECGHGTRVTSKRWAKCKKCGHRNRRRTDEEVRALMEATHEG